MSNSKGKGPFWERKRPRVIEDFRIRCTLKTRGQMSAFENAAWDAGVIGTDYKQAEALLVAHSLTKDL